MIRKTYRNLVDHLGKIISGFGATLVGMDIMGIAEPLKAFAREALGPKGVKIVALGLFIALLVRTAYTGWKAKQRPDILPPPVAR